MACMAVRYSIFALYSFILNIHIQIALYKEPLCKLQHQYPVALQLHIVVILARGRFRAVRE